jgi:hypothetical protein
MRNYQRKWKKIVEMFRELFDSLKEVFSAVNDFIKELSEKLKEYFNSPSKNDNRAPLSYVLPVSQIIGGYTSYASKFNRGKFIALVLSFHLKILPINRLQRSGI